MGKETGFTPYTEVVPDILSDAPVLTHKEECQLFNEEWNRDKQLRRMQNVQRAHGFVQTKDGQKFFNNGVSGTIYKRIAELTD